MNIEVNKEQFLRVVGDAERVTSKHVSLPVLSFIIIEAQKDVLVIKSTNLDVGVEFSLPAKVLKTGVVAVSGSVLKSFLLNVSGDKNIKLNLVEDLLVVESGTSKVSLKTASHEDFPVIPRVLDGFEVSIESFEFLTGIKSVFYSASISSIKPELSSIYIYYENKELVFVATDSFRLAEKRIKSRKVKSFEPLLIPYKNALEIVKVLESNKEDILIVSNKNLVSLSATNFHISSRLVDGSFPDYKQIIPKEFSANIVVLKQDFVQALKLSNVFSDNFNQLSIQLVPKNKECLIKTKNNDIGESEQYIKCSVIEGESLSLTFNLKYILDCIQSIPEEFVSLSFGSNGKPLVIKSSHNAGFLYLVMPMNK